MTKSLRIIPCLSSLLAWALGGVFGAILLLWMFSEHYLLSLSLGRTAGVTTVVASRAEFGVQFGWVSANVFQIVHNPGCWRFARGGYANPSARPWTEFHKRIGADRSWQQVMELLKPDHVWNFQRISRSGPHRCGMEDPCPLNGYDVTFPLWPGAAASGGAFIGLLAYRRVTRAKPGQCAACRYDLRGTPDRCPECGTPAGDQSLASSTQPDVSATFDSSKTPLGASRL